ncbi:MAG: hypothetical protein COA43_04035 [Robiginitomaculum sp.]|nr:MAG: hypothetical protein COA43_04035 [Robiginitomaculum sp.]
MQVFTLFPLYIPSISMRSFILHFSHVFTGNFNQILTSEFKKRPRLIIAPFAPISSRIDVA